MELSSKSTLVFHQFVADAVAKKESVTLEEKKQKSSLEENNVSPSLLIPFYFVLLLVSQHRFILFPSYILLHHPLYCNIILPHLSALLFLQIHFVLLSFDLSHRDSFSSLFDSHHDHHHHHHSPYRRLSIFSFGKKELKQRTRQNKIEDQNVYTRWDEREGERDGNRRFSSFSPESTWDDDDDGIEKEKA